MAARADYATKKDLEALATKKDLEAYATKKDLEAVRDTLQADIRGIGVLFEQSRTDIKAIAELVLGCASKTDVQRLEAAMSGVSERLSAVEAAVRDHSDDLRLLRNEVTQLRLQFDRRELRADELERRVAELEKRAGISRR